MAPAEPVGTAKQAVATPCTKDLQGDGKIDSGWYGIRTDGSLWRPLNPANLAEAAQRDPTLGTDNVALADMDGEAVHQCVVKTNGDLWCWGSNIHGELGRGTTSVEEAPAKVIGLPTKAKQVSVGIDGTCALLIDGSVWCWGSNIQGQLGNGASGMTPQTTPVQVVALGTGNDYVSCGYWHNCVLKAGNVSCWGYNAAYGSVGNGTFTNTGDQSISTPVQVDTNVLQLSAGGFYSCDVHNDHSLWCWGDNYWGQLATGPGDMSNRNVPTQVMQLGNTVQWVDTAVHVTCAVIGPNGTVDCWGSPENGRLGNGQLGTSPPDVLQVHRDPVPVAGPLGTTGGASYLREGKASCCVFMQNGHVFCWGAGGFIDGTGQTSSPVEVDFCGLPTLDSIAPAGGLYTGGTAVTLTGTEWKTGATVTFGTTAMGVSTTVPAPTTVKTTTPNYGFTDTVDVTVTNPDGHYAKLTKAYSFTAPPSVYQVTPAVGSDTGGDMVTIDGANFAQPVAITFGGAAVTNLAWVSATQVTAKTPAHAAGVVDVVATNPDGLTATLAMGFSYVSAPHIDSLSPATGPAGGGISVTLKGAGFDFSSTVAFGGTMSTSVTFMDANTIIAALPMHAVGVVDVTVSRADGQSFTFPQSFTYTPGGPSSSSTGVGGNGNGYNGPGNGCYCAQAGGTNDDARNGWLFGAGAMALVLARRSGRRKTV